MEFQLSFKGVEQGRINDEHAMEIKLDPEEVELEKLKDHNIPELKGNTSPHSSKPSLVLAYYFYSC